MIICNEERRKRINVWRPQRVQRLSAIIAEMSDKVNTFDPDKSVFSPDEVVNYHDNDNKLQRLSTGVYLYDYSASLRQREIEDAAAASEVKNTDPPVDKSDDEKDDK